jgi:hypothetical protein
MSTALELVQAVEANGGRFRVDGEYLVIAPEDAAAPVMEELRLHKAEIIDLLRNRDATPAEIPTDDLLPGEWLLENCLYRDRWWGGVGCLHLDLSRWCAAHGRPAPESRRTFIAALQAEGFQLTSDGLVVGLVLREDVLAHEGFRNPPAKAEPAPKRARRRAR